MLACSVYLFFPIIFYNGVTALRSYSSYKSYQFKFGLKAAHVIRVCDGPSCNRYSAEIFYKLEEKSEHSGGSLFDVAMASCLNCCKRSCNVALVPIGDFEGCIVPGMTNIEKVKKTFSNIENDEDIDRVIDLVTKFLQPVGTL